MEIVWIYNGFSDAIENFIDFTIFSSGESSCKFSFNISIS
jgi:hypothetical protein